MRWFSFSNFIVLCALCAFAFTDCSQQTNGQDGGNQDSGTVTDTTATDSAGSLQWYTTCGDPACREYRPKPTIVICTNEKEGETCTQEGKQCDIKENMCNKLLVCSKTDPKTGPGGCPISRRRYKKDIHYLTATERQRLFQQLMQTRLASYRYKHAAPKSRKRLGFIIEDQPNSPAVDARHDMVDLYAYSSMIVAAMQVQARQIQKLQQELKRLRQQCRK